MNNINLVGNWQKPSRGVLFVSKLPRLSGRLYIPTASNGWSWDSKIMFLRIPTTSSKRTTGFIIIRFSRIPCCIEHCYGKVRLWTHKKRTYLALAGELWSVYCKHISDMSRLGYVYSHIGTSVYRHIWVPGANTAFTQGLVYQHTGIYVQQWQTWCLQRRWTINTPQCAGRYCPVLPYRRLLFR